MSWIARRYKNNIYGVMGTLVFHILLVSSFLVADIDMKGKMKEEPIIIEFPDIIEEIEEVNEPEQEETQEPSDISQNQNNLRTNQAASLGDYEEDFFDEEYLKEVEDARNLVNDVNAQLEKEIPDIDDIKMPVETTEGMDPDSIKNVIYTGESNISYVLDNRYHVSLPVPIYLAQGGGRVVVDIVVDQRGNVIKANARKNGSISDSQIFYYAELAASRTVFNSDSQAPAQQKGTITYNFMAQ